MFRLIATMRRGSASGPPAAWAHYASIEDARAGAVELLREDRIRRVMVVRNEIYEDLVKAGVIDPAKVVRSALQNAASIASLLLTTEAVISQLADRHA